ncbi:hypothetical protein [Paludisphaera sp.]|uniref:hypothetical protein n=1 Tax=Paludisphaera sp. TaxID=2017432 RepID=UPI00301B9384
MRPHLLILATTGLLACAGSLVADDRDEWGRGRRGGDYKGFDEDRREYYRRFEERRREDRERYEERLRWQDERRRDAARYDNRDRRGGGFAGPYDRDPRGYSATYNRPGPEGYPRGSRPRVSPYLTPPLGYGPPRTTFDLPGLGRSGLPVPDLDVYGHGPTVTTYEVLRPRFEPGPDAQRRVIEMSDSLLGRTDSYVRDFASTAGAVPEGPQFLAEAQALNAAAARFRELAAGGAGPRRLSAELETVEAMYGPLAARTDRVAQGRTGPNIQRVYEMGDVIQRIRRNLTFR